MKTAELRKAVLRSLRRQGFRRDTNGMLRIRAPLDKAFIRRMHGQAVQHRIEQSRE